MIIKKNKKIVYADKTSKCDHYTDKEQSWFYNGGNTSSGVKYKAFNARTSNSTYTVNKQSVTGYDLEDV